MWDFIIPLVMNDAVATAVGLDGPNQRELSPNEQHWLYPGLMAEDFGAGWGQCVFIYWWATSPEGFQVFISGDQTVVKGRINRGPQA